MKNANLASKNVGTVSSLQCSVLSACVSYSINKAESVTQRQGLHTGTSF